MCAPCLVHVCHVLFPNAMVYFATGIGYNNKIFMKLTTVANVINLFYGRNYVAIGVTQSKSYRNSPLTVLGDVLARDINFINGGIR